MKKEHPVNILHHTAIYVTDIQWFIDFFEEALGMRVSKYDGEKECPTQVWLDGGIQLIAKSTVAGSQSGLAHLGLACRSREEAVAMVKPYANATCPQGENWLELPDGIILELMQSE